MTKHAPRNELDDFVTDLIKKYKTMEKHLIFQDKEIQKKNREIIELSTRLKEQEPNKTQEADFA